MPTVMALSAGLKIQGKPIARASMKSTTAPRKHPIGHVPQGAAEDQPKADGGDELLRAPRPDGEGGAHDQGEDGQGPARQVAALKQAVADPCVVHEREAQRTRNHRPRAAGARHAQDPGLGGLIGGQDKGGDEEGPDPGPGLNPHRWVSSHQATASASRSERSG